MRDKEEVALGSEPIIANTAARGVEMDQLPPPPRPLAHLTTMLHWKIQLELCWELVFRVQAVTEVHPSDAAVGMDLRKRIVHERNTTIHCLTVSHYRPTSMVPQPLQQ